MGGLQITGVRAKGNTVSTAINANEEEDVDSDDISEEDSKRGSAC